MKTHSLRNSKFSSAQFFFFGQVPLNSNCTTLAPKSWAIVIEPSVLWESTTKISSTHFTQSRQRGRFAASFLIGMMTETGTRKLTKPMRKVGDRYPNHFGSLICSEKFGKAVFKI